jgi:hypothetical protein
LPFDGGQRRRRRVFDDPVLDALEAKVQVSNQTLAAASSRANTVFIGRKRRGGRSSTTFDSSRNLKITI